MSSSYPHGGEEGARTGTEEGTQCCHRETRSLRGERRHGAFVKLRGAQLHLEGGAKGEAGQQTGPLCTALSRSLIMAQVLVLWVHREGAVEFAEGWRRLARKKKEKKKEKAF